MDNIDRRLIAALQRDGRTPLAGLAKQVGLSGPSVHARVQRLERDGVIKGYTVVLDPEKIDQGLLAFVRVGTYAATASEEQGGLEEFARREPRILECHDVDGEESYLLKVRTESLNDLRDLLAEIRGLAVVTKTVSTICLVTVKESGLTAPLGQPDEQSGANGLELLEA